MTTKLRTAAETPPLAVRTSHDLTWEMAIELFDQAGGESVRVIEALAAVLANRLQDGIACALHSALDDRASPWRTGSAARRPPLLPIQSILSVESEQRFQICRRVARRCLGGSLPDPTAGATAFHRQGEHPAWAEGLLPVAEFEPFLFYRP
jgi:hypothetical protein